MSSLQVHSQSCRFVRVLRVMLVRMYIFTSLLAQQRLREHHWNWNVSAFVIRTRARTQTPTSSYVLFECRTRTTLIQRLRVVGFRARSCKFSHILTELSPPRQIVAFRKVKDVVNLHNFSTDQHFIFYNELIALEFLYFTWKSFKIRAFKKIN